MQRRIKIQCIPALLLMHAWLVPFSLYLLNNLRIFFLRFQEA